jgi:hypothetical protein
MVRLWNTNRLTKLSVFNLLGAGILRADEGSTNISEDVINRITMPNRFRGPVCVPL